MKTVKRVKVKKFIRALTPSGLGDNGMFLRSDNTLDIPLDFVRERGIISERTFHVKGEGHVKGYVLTVDGESYWIQENPLLSPKEAAKQAHIDKYGN